MADSEAQQPVDSAQQPVDSTQQVTSTAPATASAKAPFINFQIETHNFKFAKHVSDDRHPSSVVNTSEPLVGVI